MINSILVGATLKAFQEILDAKGVPYEVEDGEEYREYMRIWEETAKQDTALRQARPAVRRVVEREPYLFVADGDPLMFRFNDKRRRMKDSFAEILLERADKDWHIAISLKYNANIVATMPVAGRDLDMYMNKAEGMFNEIDDFGSRIFGVPCSNDYFDEMNDILLKIEPHDRESWRDFLKEEDFIYDTLITPMLRAIGKEIPRICKDHPEAPQRLIDYFYAKIDYYFFRPIDQKQVTRIGAVNSHGDLGRIPDNDNYYTPVVKFPTQLLDVRFANGSYGELSKDTLQITFDGGWSVCIKIRPSQDRSKGRSFELFVYLPVTPFGSYRDQVEWDR